MSDRTVSYIFRASFNNLTAGLNSAGRSVGALGNRLTAADRQAQQFREGLTTVGDTAGKVGLAAAAGIGAIVIATANFDQAMSNVAATGSEAKASLEELRAAAIQAGADTAFSASEAAGGIENLLKAGVTASDVLGGGLSGALDLAAAGGLEVADAAEIAATALTQFKLAGEDIPHVADLLAAGAGKAQGDVSDLAMALKQSGLIAAQMGLSIEETTGTLAAFASAGLLGSDAGTSFRTMLLRLANPTAESAGLMKSLGINAYDASGQFVGMASIAGQLQKAFEGKTQAERDSALATLFGSDAIRAAAVLYSQGKSGVEGWTKSVDDAGFAADVAGTRLDNLKGDLEAFKGSLETALIGSGEGSTGLFRGLVQGATDAVNAYSKLPGPVHSTVTALLGITAILGGGLWFASKAIAGVAAMRAALVSLGVTAKTTSALVAGVGRAANVAALGLTALAVIDAIQVGAAKALPGVEALTGQLIKMAQAGSDSKLSAEFDDIGSAIDRLANPNRAQALQDNVSDVLFGIGGGSELKNSRAQIELLDSALSGLVSSAGPEDAAKAFDQLAESSNLSATEIEDLRSLLPGYKDAVSGAANAADLAAGATDGLTASTSAAADATKEETAALKKNIEAMRAKKDAALSAFDAETQWREALVAARKAAKDNSAGIRGNSKAALDNRNKLSALAAAWNNQSDAVQNAKGRYHEAREALIDTAVQMGVGRKAAERLADSVLDIPPKKVVKVTADTGAANANVAEFQTHLNNLHDKTITVTVNSHTNATVAEHKASGGYVSGRGTGTSDSIPARLSDGEFVVRASATANNLPLLRSINAEGDRRRFASGGYASRSARMYASRGRSDSWAGGSAELRGSAVVELVTPWGNQQVEVLMSNVARREIGADAGYAKMRNAG